MRVFLNEKTINKLKMEEEIMFRNFTRDHNLNFKK